MPLNFLDDIKILTEKEYRPFLYVVIWFLITFTICTFVAYYWEGILLLYIPLLYFCLILFLVSFLFEKDLKEDFSFRKDIKEVLFVLVITVVVSIVAFFLVFLLFLISIFSYILITSVFLSYNIYKRAIKIDDKLYKWPFPFNFISRTVVLVGGFFIAMFLLLIFLFAGTAWALGSSKVPNEFGVIPIILIIVLLCMMLLSIAFFFLRGRYNAWMGIYYVWVGIYALYLMLKAFIKVGGDSGTEMTPLPVQIILYIFDVFLILVTIGSIIGKKAEVISSGFEKLPLLHRIKPDAIIIWLIFSKASYEFANGFRDTDFGAIKAIVMFALYVPMVALFCLYGMYSYGKTKDRRKAEIKTEKELKKEAKDKKQAKKVATKEAKKRSLPEPNLIATTTPTPGDKEETLKETIFCTECGKQSPRTDDFCKFCGAPLKK